MLGSYPGDLGGKIGWTTRAGTTFIGWARRGHTTLVVTILHCKPLTELTSAALLLNWGFAMDGKVTPVGELVSPLPLAAPPAPHPAVVPHQHALPRPAASGKAAMPLAAGLAALVTVLATAVAVLVSRRARRAGSPAGR
jgi:D-alanyl-D-alanine carboxypeptidase (penicillin-binding protein 5/6)